MVTLNQIKKEHSNTFRTTINGKVCQARQTGKIKTWKKEPEKFLIPVKYGLYASFYIANFDGVYNNKLIENNAEDWELVNG